MNLAELRTKGAFVEGGLVPKKGVWKHYCDEAGEVIEDEVSFFVRRAAHTEFKRAASGIAPGEIEADASLDPESLMVSACIRLGDGTEIIEYADAARLESGLFQVFRRAIEEVYGQANADPKRSPPRTSSGANSSSTASAATQSKKRSSASATPKRSRGKRTSASAAR